MNIYDTDNITKKEIRKLPKDFIRLCHNEYIRRWQENNKEKVNIIRKRHYNKYKHDNINKKDKGYTDNITKISPIEFNRL